MNPDIDAPECPNECQHCGAGFEEQERVWLPETEEWVHEECWETEIDVHNHSVLVLLRKKYAPKVYQPTYRTPENISFIFTEVELPQSALVPRTSGFRSGDGGGDFGWGESSDGSGKDMLRFSGKQGKQKRR